MIKLKIKSKQTKGLANQLYEQILEWLLSGTLQEGDKLPSENELCKAFKVSRPIVRQAITKLKADEFVITKKGSGTFVLHSPLKDLGRFASANDISAIFQSHEVRIALESEAAALAASRRTTAQLQLIKEAQRQMQEDYSAGKLSIESDYDFHVGIAKAANNEIFVQLLEDSHIGLKKTMAIAQNLSRENIKNDGFSNRNKIVLEEHRRIIEAVELQDQASARLAMRFHISRIKQRIINIQDSGAI